MVKSKTNNIGLSAEDLKILFENANDIIVFTDTKGKIIDVNKRVEKVLGYKRKEVLGKNYKKLGVFELKNLKSIVKSFLFIETLFAKSFLMIAKIIINDSKIYNLVN